MRVLVIGDSKLTAAGIGALLKTFGILDVTAVSRSAYCENAEARFADPDVVLMTDEGDKAVGVDFLGDLRRTGVRAPVVMISRRRASDLQSVDGLEQLIVVKPDASEDYLLATLRAAAGIGAVPSPPTQHEQSTNPLNHTEKRLLRLAAAGASSGGIAAEVSLVNGTVRNHLSSAIRKIGARNRVEAARIASRKGWL